VYGRDQLNGSPTAGTGSSPSASPTTSAVPDGAEEHLALAHSHIEHVVFLIKENRTFDTLFGRFPGADGPPARVPAKREDGSVRMIRLRPARDETADVNHNFVAGLTAIDGAKMDGYSLLGSPPALGAYVWYSKEQIPAYWAYASRYQLADRFFSAVYGPTGPEHLWSIAGSRPDSRRSRLVPPRRASGRAFLASTATTQPSVSSGSIDGARAASRP
jgi:phospholipase C